MELVTYVFELGVELYAYRHVELVKNLKWAMWEGCK